MVRIFGSHDNVEDLQSVYDLVGLVTTNILARNPCGWRSQMYWQYSCVGSDYKGTDQITVWVAVTNILTSQPCVAVTYVLTSNWADGVCKYTYRTTVRVWVMVTNILKWQLHGSLQMYWQDRSVGSDYRCAYKTAVWVVVTHVLKIQLRGSWLHTRMYLQDNCVNDYKCTDGTTAWVVITYMYSQDTCVGWWLQMYWQGNRNFPRPAHFCMHSTSLLSWSFAQLILA
jgi:hypothetical protein